MGSKLLNTGSTMLGRMRGAADGFATACGGSVAISDCGQKDLSAVPICLCGEPLELLGK